MKTRQPFRSRNDVKAKVRELLLQDSGRNGRGFWSHFQQKKAVAALLREQSQEVRITHHQLTLEDAVGQRGDQSQARRFTVGSAYDYLVSELSMKHVRHRIRIRDHWDCAIRRLAIEQQPRI